MIVADAFAADVAVVCAVDRAIVCDSLLNCVGVASDIGFAEARATVHGSFARSLAYVDEGDVANANAPAIDPADDLIYCYANAGGVDTVNDPVFVHGLS